MSNFRTNLEKLRSEISQEILKKGSVNLLDILIQENEFEDDDIIVDLYQNLPIIEIRSSITGNVFDYWLKSVDENGTLSVIEIENGTENNSFTIFDLDVEQLLIVLESL